MVTITRKDLKKTEDYYYWTGYRHWCPFPQELKTKLLEVYGKEPYPHNWTEQDIHEGSRKVIMEYFRNNTN